jgi:hypothetical protein
MVGRGGEEVRPYRYKSSEKGLWERGGEKRSTRYFRRIDRHPLLCGARTGLVEWEGLVESLWRVVRTENGPGSRENKERKKLGHIHKAKENRKPYPNDILHGRKPSARKKEKKDPEIRIIRR